MLAIDFVFLVETKSPIIRIWRKFVVFFSISKQSPLCAFARSGLPRPGALPLSSVGCADPKNRRNSSDSAYGRRSPSGGSASFAFGSPWWASGGRPPRLRIPRGPRIAVRVLAGLSSAFNRPSVGRSAGRLNALPLVGITVSRHRASGFWGYPSTPLTALTGSQAPI